MEYSRPEQRRVFRIARRSAGECLFYMAGIRRLKFTVPEASAFEQLLLEIIRMLTPMITRDD